MVTTQCPHCGVTIEVDEKYLGKKGRCNKCKEVFVVPAAQTMPVAGFEVDFAETAESEPPSALFRMAEERGGSDLFDPFGTEAEAAEPGSRLPFGQILEKSSPPEPAASGFNPFAESAEGPFHASERERFTAPAESPFAVTEPADQVEPAESPFAETVPAGRGESGAASPAAFTPPAPTASPPPPASPAPAAPPVAVRAPAASAPPKRPRPVSPGAETKPAADKAPPVRRPEPTRPPQTSGKAAAPEPARARPDRPASAPSAPQRPVEAPRPAAAEAPPALKPTAPRVAAETPAARTLFGALKIEAIEAFLVQLPAKGTFVLAGGTYQSAGQPTPRVLVKLVGSNGVAGWGEATPCPTWCYETSETILSTIRGYLAPALIGLDAWNIDLVVSTMDRVIQPGATIGQPLAKSAIDTALHDMLARSLQVPLHVLLGGKRIDRIPLSYVVSAPTPEKAAYQTQEGLNQGYSAFKIKVGMHDEATDRRIVRAVADTAPNDAFLWVDANQGYGLDTSIRQAQFLSKLGVRAFEQPLKSSRISAFRRLVRLHRTPIAIDETLGSAADLLEYIRQDAVDLPVAKLQRCGGYWHSRKFCAVAEAAGLRLMGSGLCETDLGLSHGLQLFGAFGIDLPCDLNGRQFVESAFVRETVAIKDGFATIPDRPGSGIVIDEAKVRAFAADRPA